MTQEPSPQSKNNKIAPSTVDTARNGKTASATVSPQLQKLIPQQKQAEKRSQQPKNQQTSKQKEWSLQIKATTLALAISILPAITVGIGSYLGSQSIHQQVNKAKQVGAARLQDTESELNKQLLALVLGTGVSAVLAGGIAAFVLNRACSRVKNAAVASTRMVNRLQREDAAPRDRVAGKDELVALETNIGLLEAQLPDLLWKQEAQTERSQMLMNVTRSIWESLSQAEVYKTTVEEVRSAFKVDRVVIFRFESNRDGSFIEESVASGLPKMLWAKIDAPLFASEDIQQYRKGRVIAIDNIYTADLIDSHIGLLERFAIKAHLSAPIIKDNQLIGLLIAHQCSKPRFWQQSEIDSFAQVATQVGFALKHASLLEQVDTKAKVAQVLIDISHRIRESLNQEEILKTTVEEARKAIATERVIVYSFDADWYGTVIAESVVPGLPKAMWAQIKDPCFAENYVEKYQNGRVQATNDIYAAGLTECHLKQIEPFKVKANLVVPILKGDRLFGLLIAHECSKTRDWQQWEIDLFSQLATHVGFALDRASLLQRIDTEGVRIKLLADVTQRIRESLNEEEILKTTVEEARKAIATERVIVYSFDADWYGTVIAESVVPGLPKAMWARIKDPCFAENYVEKYQNGRVQATNNVYAAGLTECHLKQIEPFAVKANLVAPILKDDRLFGLLIAHECSKTRDWQQWEIDLFTQLAMQLGIALDRARLLKQVEQAYQAASATSLEQRQQKEALQRQVSEMLKESETSVKTLSSDAIAQMQSTASAYDRVQALADTSERIIAAIGQAQQQIQQAGHTVQSGHEFVNQTINGIVASREAILEVTQKVNRLNQPAQRIPKVVDIISNVVSQLKLYAMNIKLATSRTSTEANREFNSVAEKILTSTQQLDEEIAEIKLLVAKIQAETDEAAIAAQVGTEQAIAKTPLLEETQQKLKAIAAFSMQMISLVEEIAESAANSSQASTGASQAILEAASIASKTSEQSIAVAESFTKLAAVTQEL
ncbi:MAG TPA: GAF domain-containing protein [Leptolyngbyaceae cyanobacterium]